MQNKLRQSNAEIRPLAADYQVSRVNRIDSQMIVRFKNFLIFISLTTSKRKSSRRHIERDAEMQKSETARRVISNLALTVNASGIAVVHNAPIKFTTL